METIFALIVSTSLLFLILIVLMIVSLSLPKNSSPKKKVKEDMKKIKKQIEGFY